MSISVPGYDVGELLGYGSAAEVWSGRERSTDRRVALKQLTVDSPAAARAARTEAALLATLSHPNLIGLHDFVVTDRTVVLVLELAQGGSLADLLRRRHRLSPPEVAAALSPVAAALAAAHDEGLVHGDISAANVLFTRAGQPKLADLGLARLVGSDTALTGTPAYLDPVIAAGGAAGAASDVFSLGAVALHAVSGYGPWQLDGSEDAAAVLAAAATGAVSRLDERLADCPPAMAEVIRRALDPDPHRRGSAAEFALDLRAATVGGDVVLTAGRTSARVGRHARDRPDFARPGSAALSSVPADLTQVRASVRDLVVPPAEAGRSRVRVLAGASALVLAAAAAAWWLRPDALLRRPPQPVAAAAAVATPTSTAAATGPADVGRVLAALDARRSSAFAQRRPELLSSVYGAPALLEQDVRTLQQRVPVGCRLLDLHTTYDHLQVVAAGPVRVELDARARLSPARLHCAGVPDRMTAAAGPQVLRLVLAGPARDDLRIQSQRAAQAP